MNESKKMLEKEIQAEITRLSTLTPGTKEHQDAIDELSKLYRLKIDEANDRYFKLAADAANLIVPLIFYGVWMKRGFKFEETGTFTSTTFRGLFNRFRPTK